MQSGASSGGSSLDPAACVCTLMCTISSGSLCNIQPVKYTPWYTNNRIKTACLLNQYDLDFF